MNSKQRILAAAERRKPDRPATSLRLTPEADEKLQQYLGVSSTNQVLDALDIDLRWIGIPYIGPQERSAPTLFGEGFDFWGIGYKKITNEFNTYFEFDYHPLAEAKTVEDVDNYDWPSLDWWDYQAVPDLIDQITSHQPRAIMFILGGAFETPWYLRGMEQFLVDLYEQPDMVEAICRHVEQYYRQRTLRLIDAAGDKIDIIGSGGDVGEQNRMLLDPKIWRKLIKPFSSNLISTFKKMGFKTFYHSDGSIVPVIDDFIEMGLDILDPIQVTAQGMKPEELFPLFGSRLTFHGAIDEQELLPHATPQKVYQETKRTIDILGQRGGYIVSPTHMVQGDTSPENVLAIFEAVRNYRWV